MERVLSQMGGLRTLRSQSFCAQPLHRDVSLPQLHILVTLHEQGSMAVSGMAQLFGTSLPSASSIVDRMEERGLVSRSRDAVDRRVVSVEITDRGRQVAEEFVGLKRDQAQRILNAMTDDELTQVVEGLDALHLALARIGEAGDDPVPTSSPAESSVAF